MSAFTDYLENRLIDHVFRGIPYVAPAAIYVALFTSAPSDSGGGTEVNTGSYRRIQVGPGWASWRSTQGTADSSPSSGVPGMTSNANGVVFPVPTANWGTITHIGLFDALTGGNLLIWGALNPNVAISNGDPAPTFLATTLQVTFA